MTSIASSSPSLGAAARPAVRWRGIAVMLLGAAFILGAGFSHSSAVHNAAHDARHAAGFPCH